MPALSHAKHLDVCGTLRAAKIRMQILYKYYGVNVSLNNKHMQILSYRITPLTNKWLHSFSNTSPRWRILANVRIGINTDPRCLNTHGCQDIVGTRVSAAHWTLNVFREMYFPTEYIFFWRKIQISELDVYIGQNGSSLSSKIHSLFGIFLSQCIMGSHECPGFSLVCIHTSM